MFTSRKAGGSSGRSNTTAKFYTTLPPPPVVKLGGGGGGGAAAACSKKSVIGGTVTTSSINHPINNNSSSSATKYAPPPSSPQIPPPPRTARTPKTPRTPKTSRTPKGGGGGVSKVKTPPQQRPSTAPQQQQQHHRPEVKDPTKDVGLTLAGLTPRSRRTSTPRMKTPPPPPPPSMSPRNRRRSLNVMLPPRNMSNSSSAIDVLNNNGESHVVIDQVVRIKSLHFSDCYTPHKSHWIKCALENLGTGWIRDGKITKEQLVSEEFEEKMGVLYDLAMAKNHEAIDLLMNEQVEAQRRDRGDGGRTRGQQQQQLRRKQQSTTDKSKLASSRVKSPQQQSYQQFHQHLMDVSPDCLGGAVQRNFPFAAHFSEENKTSMSDALLSIMMREEDHNSQTASTSSGATKEHHRRRGGDTGHQHQKKSVSGGGDVYQQQQQRGKSSGRNNNTKNNNNNNSAGGDGAGVSAETNEASMASNNSFDRSLEKRSKSLVPCYVIDGRLLANKKSLLHNVGGSIVNNFGDTSRSRLRKHQPPQQQPQSSPSSSQTSLPYFRKTANMMGFLPHELTLLYCKSPKSLIISGSRPARGENENARKVREVIDLPKTVNVNKLVVLRTGKGSLIFEEVAEAGEENEENKKKKKKNNNNNNMKMMKKKGNKEEESRSGSVGSSKY